MLQLNMQAVSGICGEYLRNGFSRHHDIVRLLAGKAISVNERLFSSPPPPVSTGMLHVMSTEWRSRRLSCLYPRETRPKS